MVSDTDREFSILKVEHIRACFRRMNHMGLVQLEMWKVGRLEGYGREANSKCF